MKRLIFIIIICFFTTSCFFGNPLTVYTHYELDKQDLAQENMDEKIKSKQSELGWIILPPLDANKNIYTNDYKKKYKSIRTEYVENERLLKILDIRSSKLYYDIDSISKSYNDSSKVFKIKILKNYRHPKTIYVEYMLRRSLLSNYEITCGSNNKLKLIDEMWWNGPWFSGLRYTWRDQGSQIRSSFPEAGDVKDFKWMEEYNNLLCDVVNNKNEIKAAAWLKNKDKRAEKLKKDKDRKARKAKKDKDRKARKVKEDNRKLELDKASKTCLDLGFKKGTKKYKNCIIELL